MGKTAIGVLLFVSVVAQAEDSPLVALAKRTNRKASKTPVITNETVAKSGGRVSIASGPATPLPVLPPAPAVATAAPTAPAKEAPSTTDVGPPTTARNIDPASSARTIDPASGAGQIEPQSYTVRSIDPTTTTVRSIDPASSAQNVAPQTSTGRPPD